MTYSLYLAHINDTHSHFEPTLLPMSIPLDNHRQNVIIPCGGYAMLATAIKEFRYQAIRENIPSLLLHAGDSFQGSLYFSRFKGLANAELLNELQPDAMTIGNHEFDLGNTPLSNFIAKAKFPCLAGNMDLQHEDQSKPVPLRSHRNLFSYNNDKGIASYLLKPLQDKQLAIIGITLDQMEKIGCPDHDCHFLDAIATTKRTVEHLNNQGIVHIIVLSHLGYQGDLELAEAVSGISLIVGGHSHTLTGDFRELALASTEQTQVFINDTLILQAGKHAESIGLSRLNFNCQGKVINQEGGVKLLPCANWPAIEENQHLNSNDIVQCNNYFASSPLFQVHTACPIVSKLIDDNYRPLVEEMKANIITTLSHDYRHVRLPNKELIHGSEIAPIVSAAFYHCANQQQHTDFAMHNAGGVRISLAKGDLTQADVCGRLLPFEIQIVRYKVQGKYLRAAIEGAINNATNNGVIGTGDGSYPYCHALQFSYDSNAIKGQRVTTLNIYRNEQWQVVQDDEYYYGVSSAYTIAGKEGYDALLQASQHQDLPYSMSDAFIEYVTGRVL